MNCDHIQQLTDAEINFIGGGHDGHHPHPHLFGFHMHELVAVGVALAVLLRATYQNHPKLAIGGGLTVVTAIAASIYHRLQPHTTANSPTETTPVDA